MVENTPKFVEWKEEHINQERGSRLVHYYLEDSDGKSFLAIVGTERSLRHMLYVPSEDFHANYGAEKWGASLQKWRSKKEVIGWLDLFTGKRSSFGSPQALPLTTSVTFNEPSNIGWYQHKYPELVRSSSEQILDIEWSGDSWSCGKQLRHYRAFIRNGITISAHSFVLIMAEHENRYLAYLEDMYEDKKGQKRIKVRWFHQTREVTCKIPPPVPHPCEVFFTPFSQVISAECIDDVAVVLTPEHYAKCLATLSRSSSLGIRLCFRQYSKNKFKLFDLRSLRGYFEQPILSYIDLDELGQGNPIKRGGSKRIKFVNGPPRMSEHDNSHKLKYELGKGRNISTELRRPINPVNRAVPRFGTGDKIELLCHDSGIRGCWFNCTVLRCTHKKLKVQYDDLQDEDGHRNLVECVLVNRIAAPDKLSMRCSGRLHVRPRPLVSCLLERVDLKIGTAVDAWWSDGWWEGVVIGISNFGDDSVQVYFPGEDMYMICKKKNLRLSKDWVENKWIDIKTKTDILSVVSTVSPKAKLNPCSILVKHAESGSSAMSDHVIIDIKAYSVDEDKQIEPSHSIKTTTCPILGVDTIDAIKANSVDEDKQNEAHSIKTNTCPILGVDTNDAIKANSVDEGKQTEAHSIKTTTCPILGVDTNDAIKANSVDKDKQTEASHADKIATCPVLVGVDTNAEKKIEASIELKTTAPVVDTEVTINDEDDSAKPDEQINSRKRHDREDEVNGEYMDVDNS